MAFRHPSVTDSNGNEVVGEDTACSNMSILRFHQRKGSGSCDESFVPMEPVVECIGEVCFDLVGQAALQTALCACQSLRVCLRD